MSYVYLITVGGIDRYIGKGTGYRLNDHVKRAELLNVARARGERVRASRFYNRLAKALRNGAVIKAIILADDLTEEEAFQIERAEITVRFDLWNETTGGLGGMQHSPRTRKGMVKHAERIWSDPVTRTKLMAGLARDKERLGYIEDKRKAGRAGSREDKVRAAKSQDKQKHAEISRANWLDPEIRARREAGLKAHANSEKHKERVRVQIQTLNADPEFRAKSVAASHTPEASAKRRAAIKAWWAARKTRA